MPPGGHLKWFDITDFTPGLWEEGASTHQKIAAPPNSFIEMTNYRPMKGGGIRAFVKGRRTFAGGSTALSNGIGSGETIMGLGIRGGVVTRPGKNGGTPLAGAGVDSQILVATTVDRSSFKARVRRLDLSNDDTSWDQRNIDGSGGSTANHQTPQFAAFNNTDGSMYDVFTIAGGNTSNWGTYKMGYAAGTQLSGIDGGVTNISSHHGPLVALQARIIVAGGDTLFFTDTGDDVFDDVARFLAISPNRNLTDISGMAGIDPSDLLIMKEGAPWCSVTGDISAASVSIREMGDDHHGRQNQQPLIRVPGGVAFIEPEGRVFVTDGRTFRSVSDQIGSFALVSGGMVGPGAMAFADDLLFAPRGMVYDFSTGSWFRQTTLPTGRNWVFDPYFGEMWGTGQNIGETDFQGNTVNTANSVGVLPIFPQTTAEFSPTASFTTQPFNDSNGRNVEVREVQIFSKAHRTGSTITVTVLSAAGVTLGTVTKTLTTAEVPGFSSFLFPGLKSPHVYVKVETDSGGSAAAPTIDKMRIGFGPNNSLSLTGA